ncbi:MAG: hypothetical protein KDC66_11955 [Phaeodactylibacter sp.]|nr:hypothetical protein [Phaeodactylibacter sp.]MCB9273342.1 hypothetical protein [Lewinellaceae bacterium]
MINKTIHVICITTPLGNGGAEYEGVDGHPLYFRSTDAGLAWNKADVILPGLDSSTITFGRADTYAIDARDGTVAIGMFHGWIFCENPERL